VTVEGAAYYNLQSCKETIENMCDGVSGPAGHKDETFLSGCPYME
jgi:hypothetical protein